MTRISLQRILTGPIGGGHRVSKSVIELLKLIKDELVGNSEHRVRSSQSIYATYGTTM